MSYFLFLLFLFIFKCSEITNSKNKQRNLQSEESDDFQNIRTHIDTDCLFLFGDDNFKIFNESLNKARETIEKIVKVKRIENTIYFHNYGKDYAYQISPKLSKCNKELNIRIPADLVIFIRDSSNSLDGATDFGIPEISEYVNKNSNNRPIFGVIGYLWNTNLDNLDDESKKQVIYTHLLHEITHILGFNKTILLKKGLIKEESKKMRMNSNTPKKYYYIGENVLNRAKKYYNCSNLTGLEMDDSNGNEAKDGSKIHWSERLLLGEYMTPNFYYSEQIISEFTLDLLKDLGWYEINYFTGGLMRFGKNRGYDFMNSDCVKQFSDKSVKTNFQNEFCSNAYEVSNPFETCSSGRQSKGNCVNTYQYSRIESNSNYTRSAFSSYDSESKGFSSSKKYL